MRTSRKTQLSENIKIVITMIVIALFVVSPQIFMHPNIIISADTTFHLNRFYDTYMQIKEHNFQPFIMMYGFGGVGRFINTVYGPIFAYLCGGLLFILKSYYRLQLVLNFFTVFVAELTSFHMFKVGGIKNRNLIIIGSTLYATSFSIIKWLINNEFLGIGAALLPLVVAIAIRMVINPEKPVNIFEMSLTMILLMQIHILSSIIGLSLILVTFIYAVLNGNTKKFLLIKNSFIAAVITLLGTVNVWFVYLVLNKQNDLISPFPYANPQSRALKWQFNDPKSSIALVSAIFVVSTIVIFFYEVHKISKDIRFLGYVGGIYLALAIGVFPWNDSFKLFPAARVLQFPFRLTPIGMLLLLYIGIYLAQNEEIFIKNKSGKIVEMILSGLAIVAVFNITSVFTDALSIWNKPTDPFSGVGYLTNHAKKRYEIQDSFTSKNLSEPWKVIGKPVPDYLPQSKETRNLLKPDPKERQDSNTYTFYKMYEKIYLNDKKFKRSIVNNELQITWHQQDDEKVTVPVVHYIGNVYSLNGKKLEEKDVDSGKLGSTIISAKKGTNTLRVRYQFKY